MTGKVRALFGALALLSPLWGLLLWSACGGGYGTPMPVPPSLQAEGLYMTGDDCGTEDGSLCSPGTVEGEGQITEPRARMMYHPLRGYPGWGLIDSGPEPPPEPPPEPSPEAPWEDSLSTTLWFESSAVVATESGPDGSVSLPLPPLPEADFTDAMAYRVLIHGQDFSESFTMTLEGDQVKTYSGDAWGEEPTRSSLAGCLTFSNTFISLGATRLGRVTNVVVPVANECADWVIITEVIVWTTAESDRFAGPLPVHGETGSAAAFVSAPREVAVEPDGSTEVLVSFWPEVPGELVGFLAVAYVREDGSSPEPTPWMNSLALRATAIP